MNKFQRFLNSFTCEHNWVECISKKLYVNYGYINHFGYFCKHCGKIKRTYFKIDGIQCKIKRDNYFSEKEALIESPMVVQDICTSKECNDNLPTAKEMVKEVKKDVKVWEFAKK